MSHVFRKIIRVKVTSESTLQSRSREGKKRIANEMRIILRKEKEKEREKNSSVASVYVQFMCFIPNGK